jgi:hypothetical protein
MGTVLSGEDVPFARVGSLSSGDMNGSRGVLAGLTEGIFASAGVEGLPEGEEMSRAEEPLSSTVDGILPAREVMSRAKKSLSSTVDGHSSAMPCASTGESSAVTLRGGTSWERWNGSWLAVSTVGIVLSNDTGLGASSGGMRASSQGGVIVIGSIILERPGGLGIEIGEQRSCSSRE